MFGWIKALAVAGVKIYQMFKGAKDAGTPVSIMEGLPFALGQLLPAVDNAIKYGNMTTKEQFDSWLDTIDNMTGEDPGAIDFIKGLPDQQEEIMFDHLKEAARIYGYWRLKLPGYVE